MRTGQQRPTVTNVRMTPTLLLAAAAMFLATVGVAPATASAAETRPVRVQTGEPSARSQATLAPRWWHAGNHLSLARCRELGQQYVAGRMAQQYRCTAVPFPGGNPKWMYALWLYMEVAEHGLP
jgi:hypothetical protein